MDPSPIPESIRTQLLAAVEKHSKPWSNTPIRFAAASIELAMRFRIFLRLVKRQNPIDPEARVAPLALSGLSHPHNRPIQKRRPHDQHRSNTRTSARGERKPVPQPPYGDQRFDENCFQSAPHPPQNQREVVRLKFHSQLSYKEIAEITELSVSNVGFLPKPSDPHPPRPPQGRVRPIRLKP